METKLPLQPLNCSQYVLVQVRWPGKVKERSHRSSMRVSTGQDNQASVFHQHEIKMRRTGRHSHLWCKGCLWLCNREVRVPTSAVEEEGSIRALWLSIPGEQLFSWGCGLGYSLRPETACPHRISSFCLKVWVKRSWHSCAGKSSLSELSLASQPSSKRGDLVGKAPRARCKGERVCGSATKVLCNLVQIASHICAYISNL